MEAIVQIVRKGVGGPAKKFPFESAWIPNTAPILSEDPQPPQQKRQGRNHRRTSHSRIQIQEDSDNFYRDAHIEEFSQMREIGKGRNTVIYSALCCRTGKRVAVKAHQKSALTAIDLHRIQREGQLLKLLSHENIIKWLGSFEDAEHIYLVQEFAAGGDLFECLKKWGGTMPEKRVLTQVLIPLMKALKEMHAKGVIHRDIKPENILVTADEVIKVCDFGLAINARTERPASRLGTLQYMAPEVVKRPYQRPKDMSKIETYDEKVDIWACGVLVYELIVGYPPFDGDDDDIVTADIQHQELKEMPSAMSQECQSLVRGLLQKRPADRLTLEEMFQHSLITKHCKPEDLKAGRSARVASSKVPRDRPIDRSPIAVSAPVADAPSKPKTLSLVRSDVTPIPALSKSQTLPPAQSDVIRIHAPIKPQTLPAAQSDVAPIPAGNSTAAVEKAAESMALLFISPQTLEAVLPAKLASGPAEAEPVFPISPRLQFVEAAPTQQLRVASAEVAWPWLRSQSVCAKPSAIKLETRAKTHTVGQTWAWLRNPGSRDPAACNVRVWRCDRIDAAGQMDNFYVQKFGHSIKQSTGPRTPVSPSTVLSKKTGTFSGSESEGESAPELDVTESEDDVDTSSDDETSSTKAGQLASERLFGRPGFWSGPLQAFLKAFV